MTVQTVFDRLRQELRNAMIEDIERVNTVTAGSSDKQYRITVTTVHDWDEKTMIAWMTHCHEHPQIPFDMGLANQRKIRRGETVLVADNKDGRTFVKAELLQ